MRCKVLALSFLFMLIFQAGAAFAVDKPSGASPAREAFRKRRGADIVNAAGPADQPAVTVKPAQAADSAALGPAFNNAPDSSPRGSPVSGGPVGEMPAIIVPEVTTQVDLSSSDINRFVCPPGEMGPIHVVFSKEKGVSVNTEGRNAFVKFLIKQEDGKNGYSTTPTEFYVICGRKVYTLIGLPERIPARTVLLSGGDDEARKNASLFEGMPFEKKILRIVKSVYTEDIPDSFTVNDEDKPFDLYKGIGLTLVRSVRIEGQGLKAKEFAVEAREDVELSEKDFLKRELTSNPVAVAIDKLKLSPGETARVIIVERASEGRD